MNKKILAIVVTYNGREWVDYCLGSLVSSRPCPDIICIDNNSDDGTQSIVSEKYPNVQLVSLKSNLGFGKANNIGLEKCLNDNYDYAFLLNQDARVESDTISKLVTMHMNNPQYGVLSPIHRSSDCNVLDRNFTIYLNADYTPGYLSNVVLGGEISEVYSTKFVNAALWLISKECLSKVGLFDRDFTHYGEDNDYLYRVHAAGLNVGIVPSALGNHARDVLVNLNNSAESNKLKSTTNRDYMNLLLRYKRFPGSKPKKKFFFFREMVSELFRHLLMLDTKKMYKTLLIYSVLLRI